MLTSARASSGHLCPKFIDTVQDLFGDLVNSETNEYRLKQMNEHMESIALGIANGMRHMHQHDMVHHDLKPQNIGFDCQTQTV